MKNYTPEEIENVLNEAFIKTNENIAMQFPDEMEKIANSLKEESNDALNQSIPYYAAINVAQANMLDTIKEALSKLLCD